MDTKLIDGQKLQFHPHRVAQWVDGKDDWETAKNIYPIYVEFSPSGACQHRCLFCSVDYIGYKPVLLDAAIFAKRIEEMAGLGVKSVMFAGEGEPLLHKQINMMVDACNAYDVDCSFTTNGVLLDKLDLAGVSWVKVSLNAGTRESYAKIHGTKAADWDKVWKNLEDAVKRKGDCTVGVQCVLLDENAYDLQELALACRGIGLDYLVIKPYTQAKYSINRRAVDNDFYRETMLALHNDWDGVLVRDDSMQTKVIPYDKCHATPYFWAYVMANGDVYSCSAYLLDDRFKLGNLNEQTFKEIWHGERRRANWDHVRNHLDITQCRVNCRPDKINRYLDMFGKVQHVNFV